MNPGEWATVKVDEHGKVAVLIGVSGSGQGHETVFAQVCAEYLGARFEDIHVRGGDTALVPTAMGPAPVASPSTRGTPWPTRRPP